MASFYVDVIQVGVGCLLIVAIGYILSFFNILKPDEFKCANTFSAKACFPFLLYRSLAARKLREITFAPLANALLMSASTQILLCVLFLLPFKDKLYMYLSTVVSSAYINYIIIGIPIFSSIWGTHYNHIPAICSFCHYILLVPLYMIWSQLWKIKKTKEEIYQKKLEKQAMQEQNGEEEDEPIDESQLRITVKDVVMAFASALKTPLVIGNFVGLIWSAIGLDYPVFFNRIGEYLGNGVVVYALIGIGRFLHKNTILSCHWAQLLLCLCVRFFVCPGFSCLYAWALGLDHTLARQCVILSALPAANAGFILANSTGIGANVASAMVFWSLIFIVPVLMLWFFIFEHFNLFVE